MTKFSSFERNRDVTDVLFCIVSNKNTVKDIVKTLKQPQSTVSSKLQFLRNSKVVIKDKWEYQVNWKVLEKVFLKEMKDLLGLYFERNRKKRIEYFIKLFDDKRIRRIFDVWSKSYVEDDAIVSVKLGHRSSIVDMCVDYLMGLSQTDSKVLEKIDKRFIELKNHITLESPEKFMFEDSEGIEIT